MHDATNQVCWCVSKWKENGFSQKSLHRHHGSSDHSCQNLGIITRPMFLAIKEDEQTPKNVKLVKLS